MKKPLKIFITYARTDTKARDELIKYLAVMKRNRLIDIWYDTKMLGGDRWQEEIFSTHLPTSDLLLYLVSADSLASENCYKEFEIAREKKIRVIPIIFSDCDWESDQLSDLQGFPDNFKPINEWTPESKGWKNVVKGIRKTITDMLSQADPDSGISEKELQAETVFQHGNVLMKLERLDMAIEAYSDAIGLNPRHAGAYNNRGLAYCDKGDFDKAIQDYNTTMELGLDDAEAYINRGVANDEKGDFENAIRDFTKAIQLKPDLATAYYNRGNVYFGRGDFDKAIQDYNTAIQLESDYTKAYYNRGNVHFNRGDSDKAIQDYNTAIRLKPDYAEAYNNRGVVYGKKGEQDLAIKDCNTAIKLKFDYAEAYTNRGEFYRRKGEIDLAIEDHTKAMELKSNYGEAYRNRGLAYKEKGEQKKPLKTILKQSNLNLIMLMPITVGALFMVKKVRLTALSRISTKR